MREKMELMRETVVVVVIVIFNVSVVEGVVILVVNIAILLVVPKS